MSVLRNGLALVALAGAAMHGGAVAAQSTAGSLAGAQSSDVDLFARDRSVAVRDRARPEYEAVGLPFGTFTAFPRVEFIAELNDNIFATSTGEVDDIIFKVKPEVSVLSGWSRHALEAYARASSSRYQDFETENSEDWGVGIAGRADVTRGAHLAAGADYARLTEPRTSSNAPAATAEPIMYDISQAFLAGARVTGRLKLAVRGDIRSFDYDDGFTVGNVEIDQDNRDRDVTSLTGRADYAISPATAVFVQVTGNERDYDIESTITTAARDSSGYEVLAGVNFEAGAVARGEVAVGYITQDFDDARFDTISGFGTRVQLAWFPTDLTTVTATGSRTIEDSGINGSNGYLASSAAVQVDHELLRNVILTGQITYSQDDYDGIDREDGRFGALISGTYLINRRVGVSLAASHLEQSSDGANAGSSYDVNRLTLSLVTQF